MAEKRTYRIMISGGGTGGHVYPAISIAQSLQDMIDVEILFVGAKGKLEMKKVPEAGFKIVGIWISGLQRSLSLQNLLFPFKVLSSLRKSFSLIRSFKPDAVVGVGGYASGPLLYAATIRKIPTLIQEQNSYAGLTNKLLSGKVNKICVAHGGMEKYFPKEKLVVTGNPVRKTILLEAGRKRHAYEFFGFSAEKETLLVIGGSLGARALNEFMIEGLPRFVEKGYQVIWQTGGYYFEEMKRRAGAQPNSVKILDFLREMDFAYAVADVVVSRAGALSIAELMLTGKPSILVPSPNVADDHQTINARALVERNAALMVRDSEGKGALIKATLDLFENKEQREILSRNIHDMARPNASNEIAQHIIQMIA